MTVERFQRQAFEKVSEPRVPAIRELARMLASFQTGVLEALAPLYRAPWVRGVEVTLGAKAAGTFNVLHKLGREPRGWLVLDVCRAAAATGDLCVYRRLGDTRDARTLTLYTSASFESLTLWVW